MDAFSAGQLSRALDRLHSTIYFAPAANERFSELGLKHERMQYFASRSAPMGAVTAKVVAATFYNFNPELVAKAIPAAWEVASPATVTRVRYEIVDAVIPKILGDERVRSPEFAHSTAIVRRAAEAIPNADGRALYAGHAELDWPEPPHAQLWHAITLLREYRGDGHVAALVTHGLSGLEALITHVATGTGFAPDYGRKLRGWSQQQWDESVERLRSRGLLDDEAQLTAAGNDLRSKIEDLTDDLAYAPWRTVSDDDVQELVSLGGIIRAAVRAAGLFPSNAFGPRYGQHR
jgi:helix-turn-helix protein